MTSLYDHEPQPWYWGADTEFCPHGAEPNINSAAWDAWAARHKASDQTDWICLDAPMGDQCPACSEEHGDAVPWADCEEREPDVDGAGRTYEEYQPQPRSTEGAPR